MTLSAICSLRISAKRSTRPSAAEQPAARLARVEAAAASQRHLPQHGLAAVRLEADGVHLRTRGPDREQPLQEPSHEPSQRAVGKQRTTPCKRMIAPPEACGPAASAPGFGWRCGLPRRPRFGHRS